MLKQAFGSMSKFFTRERFGRPQFLAALMLLVFLFQCGLLAMRATRFPNADPNENRILGGLQVWGGRFGGASHETAHSDLSADDELSISQRDSNRSPMYYVIAAAPFVIWPGTISAVSPLWSWLSRGPFIGFGILLGASLWYVARRLYGNAGGYIALALYCFAPGFIRSSAIWFAEPETGAAWGAFGAVFTAIAVAHTLYAPREVILWNWRRILLLGLSLALAIGSQFSLVVLLPVVLLLMLYVAPTRQGAAAVIWLAACGIAAILLFASYGFHPVSFLDGFRHASLGLVPRAFGMAGAYRRLWMESQQLCPALEIALPAALITFVLWKRTRYFGNTAPLIVAVVFIILGVATPHYPGMGFRLLSLPFFFLFVAGVAADLLETRYRSMVLASIWGLLVASGMLSLVELIRSSTT